MLGARSWPIEREAATETSSWRWADGGRRVLEQTGPGEAWEDGAGGGAQLAAAAAVGADQGGRLDGGAGGEPSTRRVAVDAAGRTAAASGSREVG